MAWIRVESSVARNRKFVTAGPAASWLWLCGLAYCQEGLTDGFIPSQALAYLGVKNPSTLTSKLVTTGLWELMDDGWIVHDYLDHNKTATEVRRIQQERRDGGRKGGRPNNLEGKPSDRHKVNLTENPSTAVRTATTTSTAEARTAHVEAFERFWLTFPRKVGKPSALKAWLKLKPDPDTVAAILAAVASQSRTWDEPKFIPYPATWLNDERWKDDVLLVRQEPAFKEQPDMYGHFPPCQNMQDCTRKALAEAKTNV